MVAVSGVVGFTVQAEKQAVAKMEENDITELSAVNGDETMRPIDAMMDANSSSDASTTQVTEEAFSKMKLTAAVAEDILAPLDADVPKPAESMIAVADESLALMQQGLQSDSVMGNI